MSATGFNRVRREAEEKKVSKVKDIPVATIKAVVKKVKGGKK